MKKILFILLLIVPGKLLLADISIQDQALVMENQCLITKLSFKNGRIVPVSIYLKQTNRELLDLSCHASWFEFVIDHQLITANDPIWKYRSHTTRKLNNGGEEVKIIFEAEKKVKGLQIEIYRQYFPQSTLIRERLILKSQGKTLALNKLNNKLHFIFPCYALKTGSRQGTIKEIKIASFANELLDSVHREYTYDDRKFDNGKDFNLAHCHMFHPEQNTYQLSGNDSLLLKGPFGIYRTSDFIWLSAYEHASQDKNYETVPGQLVPTNQSGTIMIDQSQGVVGKSGLRVTKDDFWFLALKSKKLDKSLVLSLNLLRGGYLEGETIDTNRPYESVWAVSSVFTNENEIKPAIHNYLWNQITEHPASRKTHFYYNTWGMQRETNKADLYNIFTEARILDEIRNAAELNVDLFVLDDGWEQTMGVWQPNKTRLPNGFTPLLDEMRKYNMVPGAWLSPFGIDSLADRFVKHQEWVIRDESGKPIKAQWDFPAFDFESGFYKLFIEDCKKLIDQGFRFFKWDAINTLNSTLAGLDHGSSIYSKEEIRDRYAYLLPFFITRAMRELREYNSDVVVELDLTEKERCLVGLMPLQEGKLFWMNNGASGYNDYSKYRGKSMRTVLDLYAGIIPTELMTQAVYPHNEYPFFAQRYNVNTTLLGGYGFWGNLQRMNHEQRLRVGKQILKFKKILPYITGIPLQTYGSIGSSPEIYIQMNQSKGAGQIIGFSGSAIKYPFSFRLQTDSCLGVINHAYRLENGSVSLPFEFSQPDDTREAFVLPNLGTGINITSSTAWLDNIELFKNEKELIIYPGIPGSCEVQLPDSYSSVTFSENAVSLESNSNSKGFRYYHLNFLNAEPIIVKWLIKN